MSVIRRISDPTQISLNVAEVPILLQKSAMTRALRLARIS
jgi:hypothetical protein